MATSVEQASIGLGRVLAAVGDIGGDVEAARRLLTLLGWDLPPGADDIGLGALDLAQAGAAIERLAELRSTANVSDAELAAAIAAVVSEVAEALAAIEDVAAGFRATPAYLQATGIVDAFFPRLADVIVVVLVAGAAPAALPIAVLLGLVELELMPADPARFQVRHVRQTVRWDRFGALLGDPAGILREVYGWGTPDFDGDALVSNLARVLEHVATDVSLRPLPRLAEERVARRSLPQADAAPGAQLFASLAKGLGREAFDVGVTLYPLRATMPGGTDGGLGVSPYAIGTATRSFPLSQTLALGVEASAELERGLALVVRAGRDPELLAGVAADAVATAAPAASFRLSLRRSAPAGERQVLFSAPALQIAAAAVRGGVGVDDRLDPQLVLAVEDGRLHIAPDRSDGFLAAVLPADGIGLSFDAGLAWSHGGGLRFEGEAGLAATIALQRRLGPLRLDALTLALRADAEALTAEATVRTSALLGPVTATIDRIGAAAVLRFERGNLGAVDLVTTFVPPSAIGLRVDAGVVKGGGFLRADHARKEYAGALELTLGAIGVKAIGMLADRPGGWSLMLLLYGQFPPIQLPFGITLHGLGGVVALHHGVDVAALTAGMRSGAFDAILFPPDPVADAPRIIERLRTVFPPRAGALTVGPMVDLGWGRPRRIVFARLAFLVQLDNALGAGPLTLARIVLLGTVRVAVGAAGTNPDTAIVRLVVDVLGFWDATLRRYGFRARLRDSRLGPIDVSGELAVWGEYGDHARFLLSAGGFNPRFKDLPAEMSGGLDRLGAGFKVGSAELKIAGYFAITPATIQAGLEVSAKGKVGPVGFKGAIGFDVIVYQEPRTYFVADFRVSFEVSFKGRTLSSVKVTGTLEGPGAWHIDAKITFSILWWDVSKRWVESWGDEPPAIVVATDVRALIAAELADAANWSAQLPRGGQAMASVAPDPGATETLAHPLGRFVFSQRVAPLGLELARFGAGGVSGTRRFDVERVRVGDATVSRIMVREHFARAQFVEMSEDEKLTRPSFEPLDAGVEFSSEGFRLPPTAIAADMDFEPTAYLDIDPRRGNRTRRDPATRRAAIDHAVLGVLAREGAAGRAALRRDELVARRAAGTRVDLSAPPLAAADRAALAADPAIVLTGQGRIAEMAADQLLGGRAQLVEAHELVGS